MSKWLAFRDRGLSASAKTRRWAVQPKDGGRPIGLVIWHSPWRLYCFAPNPNTMFEQDCLRDIAEFIQARTREHKRLRRARAE